MKASAANIADRLALPHLLHGNVERLNNRTQSRVRSKVEHAFWIIKGLFGFTKVRYRGLAKNLHRLQVT